MKNEKIDNFNSIKVQLERAAFCTIALCLDISIP